MKKESAAAIRDQASRRVRRLTAFAIAGATALTAAFAGIAAGSTHTKSSHPATPKQTTRTVTAPEPTLTPNGSTATPQAATPSQQPTPTVTPSTQPPVAATGGS